MRPEVIYTVGFTGPRDGMTLRQKTEVHKSLLLLKPSHALHGLCTGADEDFHHICRELWELGIYIIGHPGMDNYGKSPYRAHCDVDEIEPILPYMERNQNIVNNSDILIATPSDFVEMPRSGTWSTIRKARNKKRTLFIVFPDGTTSSK